jgi:chromosome segregation ATPase
MIITTEKLNAAKAGVDKLIEQGQVLFGDITETTQDRERLLQEIELNKQTISHLSEEILELEARLGDALARLESISTTAQLDAYASVPRNGRAGALGVAALEKLAATRTNGQN